MTPLGPLTAAIDRDVRIALFALFAELGRAPTTDEVAARAALAPDEVHASYERLHEGHVIVLDPAGREVWMANPFSAVATPYRVRAGEQSWFANCIWDGLGICALLDRDGTVETECADCGAALAVTVRDGEVHGAGVAHFLVPAAHFWDDIGFT